MTSELRTLEMPYFGCIENVGNEVIWRNIFPMSYWWRVENLSPNVFLSTVFLTSISALEIQFPTLFTLMLTFLCVGSGPSSCNVTHIYRNLTRVLFPLYRYFVLDFTDHTLNKYIEHQMLTSFKEYRADLHRHFKKCGDLEQARAKPLTKLKNHLKYWKFLCDHYLSQ